MVSMVSWLSMGRGSVIRPKRAWVEVGVLFKKEGWRGMRPEGLVEEALGSKLRCSFQDGQRPVQQAKPLIQLALGPKPGCSFQERSGTGGVWRPGCAGVRGF